MTTSSSTAKQDHRKLHRGLTLPFTYQFRNDNNSMAREKIVQAIVGDSKLCQQLLDP